MKLKLLLRGPLKKYGPGDDYFDYEIDADSCTTGELLQNLGIAASSVSFIQVNGKKAEPEALLKGGETLIINPRVVGG